MQVYVEEMETPGVYSIVQGMCSYVAESVDGRIKIWDSSEYKNGSPLRESDKTYKELSKEVKEYEKNK